LYSSHIKIVMMILEIVKQLKLTHHQSKKYFKLKHLLGINFVSLLACPPLKVLVRQLFKKLLDFPINFNFIILKFFSL